MRASTHIIEPGVVAAPSRRHAADNARDHRLEPLHVILRGLWNARRQQKLLNLNAHPIENLACVRGVHEHERVKSLQQSTPWLTPSRKQFQARHLQVGCR